MEIFVPLVEHYIVLTALLDHLLVEAINTLGRIAKQLQWSAYHSLVVRTSKDKVEVAHVHVRTLVAILEYFHISMEEGVEELDMAVIVDDETLEGEENATEIQPPPIVPFVDVKKYPTPSMCVFSQRYSATWRTGMRTRTASAFLSRCISQPVRKKRRMGSS